MATSTGLPVLVHSFTLSLDIHVKVWEMVDGRQETEDKGDGRNWSAKKKTLTILSDELAIA